MKQCIKRLGFAGLMMVLVTAYAQNLTVSFWGGAGEARVIESMIDACLAEHSDISVEHIWVQGPYEQQLLTMIAGGTAPDVMAISSGNLPGFADQFIALDLDPSLYAQPVSVAGMTFAGELRAAPHVAKSKVMGLNVNAFEAAGVALPSPTEALSPDAFRELAISLASGTGEDRKFGSERLWFGQWLYAFGGNFYNEDSTKVIISSATALETARFIVEAATDLHYAPNAIEREGVRVFDWFLSGKVAMWPDFGPWFLPAVYDTEDLKWEVVRVPGQGAPLEINGFAVSKDSPQQEKAVRLATCLSSSDAAQTTLGKTMGLGIPVTAAGQAAFIASDPDHNLSAFIRSIETSLIQPAYCQDAQVQGEFYRALFSRTAIGSGSEPIEAFFPDIETYLNDNFSCN